MKKETDRYRCIGDSGREYTVIEYQHIIRTQLKSGPPQDVPATKEWFLSDDQDVNYIETIRFRSSSPMNSFGRSARANFVQYMPPPLVCIPIIA
jgi:hypothetical protein